MEANPEALSSIKVNFGERQSSPTPIDLNFALEIFSSEVHSCPSSMNLSETKLLRNTVALNCPQPVQFWSSSAQTPNQWLAKWRSRSNNWFLLKQQK